MTADREMPGILAEYAARVAVDLIVTPQNLKANRDQDMS